MKKSFPGYYRPTEKGFAEMWEGGTFVFDANVLLNLYRYSPETKDELLGMLQANSDRLWLPHQAAKEYHKNRIFVILQIAEVYDSIKKLLEDSQNKIQNELHSMIGKRRHPFVGENLIDKITTLFTGLQEEVINLSQNHPNLIENDPILDTITNLFENKVGSAYNSDELNKIYQKGKERYDKKIPPGYRDNEKGELEQFGDLVMWFQIIDYAKKNKQPIIFVTDDRKDDWWLRIKGQTIGPHPELVQEIVSEAGIPFYMYSTDPFMEQAHKHLEQKVNQQAIEEVREIRHYDEKFLEAAIDSLASLKAALDYPTITKEMLAAAMAASKYPTIAQEMSAAAMAALKYPTITNEMLATAMAASKYPTIAQEMSAAAMAALKYPMITNEMLAAAMAAPKLPRATEEMLAAVKAAPKYPTSTKKMPSETNATVSVKTKKPTKRKLTSKAVEEKQTKQE